MKILGCVLISICLFNCKESKSVALVKQGHFHLCPDKTIEEVTKSIMAKREWETSQGEGGAEKVDLGGVMRMDNRVVDVAFHFNIPAGAKDAIYNGMDINKVSQPEHIALKLFHRVCKK